MSKGQETVVLATIEEEPTLIRTIRKKQR